MSVQKFLRRSFLKSGAATVMLPWAPVVRAQSQQWPSQPIKLIVPFTPGTGADLLARLSTPYLSTSLGQPVIVDNRVGASGAIGTAAVANATDGHTFLLTANTIVTDPAIQTRPLVDPFKQLAPISKMAVSTFALAVNPSFPAKTLREAVAIIKKSPGKYTYASPGPGTPQHLAMELLKYSSGIYVLHVPYKGSAGAVTDLIGGQVDMMIFPLHFALPYSSSGSLRLLGVPAEKRSPKAPSIPTFEEQGVSNANVDAWFALFSSSGTPNSVKARLNAEIQKVLTKPDVVSALDKQGLIPQSSSTDQLDKLMHSDFDRWKRLVKNAGITAE